MCRMNVVVAGGHGQIGLRLLRLLAERGDHARGLIRNPDHAGDLEAVGAEAVVCDLEFEDDVAPFVAGAEAIVFAAGAGPGSGAERKRTMDLGGALKLIEAARRDGIARYVIDQLDRRRQPRDRVRADAPLHARRRPRPTARSPTAGSTSRSSARAG